jgi:hypothetical protein
MLLTELRRETQAAEKAGRRMVRAAWLMAIIGLAALSGGVGIFLASLR